MTILEVAAFALLSLSSTQADRSPIDQPEAQAKSENRPTESSTRRLTGNATWYRYRVAQGAAGPGLRKWLGKNWRGQTVTVCRADNCVSVKLTDWCLCSRGNRIIDLDVRSFDALGDPGEGVIKVSVTR